jgi:2-amino-4-hydroxy-6-hydroxymethyldihydropteridine diphosphokinase
MAVTYLGLGSNLGDRKANLEQAIQKLAVHPKVKISKISSFHETVPVGYEAQPDFLNAVVEVETTLDPKQLLDLALSIETSMGRKRTIRWGPRVIDIDILLYDNEHIEEDGLSIPHPRMLERRFVVEPLAEVAPDLKLPNGLTARETAKMMDGTIREKE